MRHPHLDVFDTQIAFNMVGHYGEKSQPTLESVEQRILKHYRHIAAKDAPQPSLLLLQAPIFHGHSFAIYVEMEKPVALGDLSQALAGDHVKLPSMGSAAKHIPS